MSVVNLIYYNIAEKRRQVFVQNGCLWVIYLIENYDHWKMVSSRTTLSIIVLRSKNYWLSTKSLMIMGSNFFSSSSMNDNNWISYCCMLSSFFSRTLFCFIFSRIFNLLNRLKCWVEYKLHDGVQLNSEHSGVKVVAVSRSECSSLLDSANRGREYPCHSYLISSLRKSCGMQVFIILSYLPTSELQHTYACHLLWVIQSEVFGSFVFWSCSLRLLLCSMLRYPWRSLLEK
jgi:hypothetical protein